MKRVITLLSGIENIVTVTHCITRLLFVFQLPPVLILRALKQLLMIKGSFITAGYF
ncbi:MAG: PTS transporter subunit EIIB [Candidatus Malihini olakiniferum]